MAARRRQVLSRTPAAPPCGCRPGWVQRHPTQARACGRRMRGGRRQPSQPGTRFAGSAAASRAPRPCRPQGVQPGPALCRGRVWASATLGPAAGVQAASTRPAPRQEQP
eukprot:8540213-Alexandrium_andersonii.AAC.1